MHSLEDVFGVSPDEIHASDDVSVIPYATTSAQDEPPHQAHLALLDPQGSAVFWVALAAVLGLILVTGQLKISAALRTRAGR
jgi:hypothetical protein